MSKFWDQSKTLLENEAIQVNFARHAMMNFNQSDLIISMKIRYVHYSQASL